MPELRAGVIGVGYLGNFHADKYRRIPGVRLVGLADTDFGVFILFSALIVDRTIL